MVLKTFVYRVLWQHRPNRTRETNQCAERFLTAQITEAPALIFAFLYACEVARRRRAPRLPRAIGRLCADQALIRPCYCLFSFAIYSQVSNL